MTKPTVINRLGAKRSNRLAACC
uniref:Uncharacterized protein n=1 Tax=Rhizophora mucronata TaxID=61149 RepID=A0A2P2PJG1_RHIMU